VGAGPKRFGAVPSGNGLAVLVPPNVVMVTSTVPVPAPRGTRAVIELSELTVNLTAAIEPNLTALAPANPTIFSPSPSRPQRRELPPNARSTRC
jgi:hypothetical protein